MEMQATPVLSLSKANDLKLLVLQILCNVWNALHFISPCGKEPWLLVNVPLSVYSILQKRFENEETWSAAGD